MTVAHGAAAQSHASGSFSVSQASFSWTHTPTGTPRGAVVLVFQGVASADAVTSVTYGGVTMTHVGSARAADTATEPGSVDVYFLGSSVPTGAQTVQVNRTNNTTTMWAVSATQTAATDTEIAGIVLVQENGVVAEQSVDDGSTGVDSVRYSGVYYGGATPAPAGANSTLLFSNDAGAYGWTAVQETTAGQGIRSVGCTQATSDDRAIVAFAVREIYTPPGPTITPFETADWTSTGATKTITVPGAVTGDKIVILYGGDNGTGGSNVSAASASTTGGSTSSWTEPEEGLAAGSQAWASSSAADVTADGTVTVTLSRTQSTGQPWGGWAALVHNHNGVGVHARSAPSATETVTLTGITQDSAVLILGVDWDDLTNVAFSPAGAIDVERSAGTNVAWYAGYWLAQAAGTRNYGIATSSTTNLHIIAIEMLAASGVLTLSPTGIASAEAFGTAAASLTLTANPTGISSAETFGTASATFQTSTSPTGIASAEAFGAPTATPTLTASPTGIASAQTFGTAVASASLTTSPTGIASAEAFGTAAASPVTATAPTGIPTAELFGAVAVALSLLLGPTGVPSAEAFGTGTATATLTASPSGIASAQAFGTAAATPGQLTASPSGVASAEAWGTAAATLSTLTASPTGIPSAEAFGSAAVTVSGTAAPVGILSSEAFGVPVVALALSVAPTGIGSLAAFGVPVAALSLTVSPTGIASGQAFGVPVASPVLVVDPIGIPSAQVVGAPSAALSLAVAPVGIPSAETFGTVVITGGSVTPVRDLALTGSIQAKRFSGTIVRGRYAGSLKPGRMTGDLTW